MQLIVDKAQSKFTVIKCLVYLMVYQPLMGYLCQNWFTCTYEVISLQVRMDLGVVVMKGYTHTPKYFWTGASLPDCGGVSPTDRLTLSNTYRLSSLLHRLSEPSPRTDVMFMIVLSWGEVSPSYRLCMYYFPSIYFLSFISESYHHFNLPLANHRHSLISYPGHPSWLSYSSAEDAVNIF